MSTCAGDTHSALIDVAGLRFRYPGAAVDALDGLDLRVHDRELLVVVGANGSGKSTLVRLLGGLEKPRSGERAVACGHDLLTEDGRVAARRDVGVLFQNPENQLVAECVEQDVAFGLENLAWTPADMRRRVDEILARFELLDQRRRPPHLLSGGQKQRVALAGVLAVPRRALLLDEPTAMLDPAGKEEVLRALAELREEGLATVLVTQEMAEVAGADRVVALDAGRCVFDGLPEDLFEDAELVARLRIGLPPPAELALALGRRGQPLPRVPMTLDELLQELPQPS